MSIANSKVISPVFEKLSESFTNIDFYKVDVDSQEVRPALLSPTRSKLTSSVPQDIAAEVAIKAMPTFLFFQSGAEVGKVVGADPNKLKVSRRESGGERVVDH